MLLQTRKPELKVVRDAEAARALNLHLAERSLPQAHGSRVDVAGLRAVVQSLARAVEVVEAAVAAAVSIEEVLRRMRAIALEAADPSYAGDRAPLAQAFRALVQEIPYLIADAELNGINLLAQGGGALEALLDADTGESVRVAGEDLTPGGPNLLFSPADDLTDSRQAQTIAGLIGLSLAHVERAIARLVLGARKLKAHGSFVRRLAENLGLQADGTAATLVRDGQRLYALAEAQRELSRLEASGPAATLLALFR